jgi:hypothetical protein
LWIILAMANTVRYRTNAGAIFSLWYHLPSRLPILWSRSCHLGSVGHVSEATVRRPVESPWARM